MRCSAFLATFACSLALVLAVGPLQPSAAAGAPRCAASGLVVWLDTRGSAAAGSSYYTLEFTNLSGHACTLAGYPGVSAIDRAGHQVGSAAGRNPSPVRLVRLARGDTATAVLQIVQAANFPPAACHRVTAAGLRVYPPNQTAARIVPFPFPACSRRGPVFLQVKALA